MQAHTRHSSYVFYRDGAASLVIGQYVSSTARLEGEDGPIDVRLELVGDAGYVGPDSNAGEAGDLHRPHAWRVRVTLDTPPGSPLRVRLRVPEWTDGAPAVVSVAPTEVRDGFLELEHPGGPATIEVAFPFALRVVPIPDEPTTVAFVEGPIVLAGLVDGEVALQGDPADAAGLLAADNERQWTQWLTRYRTVGQARSIRMLPLHEITDESFSVYFPITPVR